MAIGGTGLTAPVFGFGYQGLTQGELLQNMVAAGVTVVVDVRLNAISRKRGLSKTALMAAANDAGLRYLHLRGLGNPKWNREGFATPDPQARRVYRELLGRDEGRRDLEALRLLSASEHVGLLCFEAAEQRCHRAVILELLAAAWRASFPRRRRRQAIRVEMSSNSATTWMLPPSAWT